MWRRLAESNGRQAHQPVDALLGRQQAVDVLALDRDGGALDAGLVALLDLVDLDLEAAALEPAQVHAQQHLGPVLGLGAAGAGVDGDDGAALVELAAEEALLLAARESASSSRDAVGELGEELVVDSSPASSSRSSSSVVSRSPKRPRARRTRRGALDAAVLGGDPGGVPGRPRSRGPACAPRARRARLSARGGQR